MKKWPFWLVWLSLSLGVMAGLFIIGSLVLLAIESHYGDLLIVLTLLVSVLATTFVIAKDITDK